MKSKKSQKQMIVLSQKQGFQLGTSGAGYHTTDCNNKIPEGHTNYGLSENKPSQI